MREWYSKQKFFSQEKLNKIQEWIEKEVIDLFQYTSNYVNKKIGA